MVNVGSFGTFCSAKVSGRSFASHSKAAILPAPKNVAVNPLPGISLSGVGGSFLGFMDNIRLFHCNSGALSIPSLLVPRVVETKPDCRERGQMKSASLPRISDAMLAEAIRLLLPLAERAAREIDETWAIDPVQRGELLLEMWNRQMRSKGRRKSSGAV
jgi:hypothetical protein